MYSSQFQLDFDSDRTYYLSETIMFPSAGGSGFRVRPRIGGPSLVEPVPVSRAHVRFVGRAGSSPLPPSNPSPISSTANAVTVYVARSVSPDDTSMSLGGGRNTNVTGLGDSQHAVSESSLPVQGQC